VRARARCAAGLPACLPPAQLTRRARRLRRAAAVRRRFAALDARLAASVEREDRRVQALTEALLYTLLPAALAAVAGPADDLAAGLRPERCRVRPAARVVRHAVFRGQPASRVRGARRPWRARRWRRPRCSTCRPGCWSFCCACPGRAWPTCTGPAPGRARRRPSWRSATPSAGAWPTRAWPSRRWARWWASCCGRRSRAACRRWRARPPARRAARPPRSARCWTAPRRCTAPPCAATRRRRACVSRWVRPRRGHAVGHAPSSRARAQVDHLLFCGADVGAATAAGETAVELVPLCGDRGAAGERACRCMSAADGQARRLAECRCRAGQPAVAARPGPRGAQVWECRSRMARALVAQRACLALGAGLLAWARLLLLSLACLAGLAGCAASLQRPAVERHAAARADARRAAARDRALARPPFAHDHLRRTLVQPPVEPPHARAGAGEGDARRGERRARAPGRSQAARGRQPGRVAHVRAGRRRVRAAATRRAARAARAMPALTGGFAGTRRRWRRSRRH